MRLKFSFLMVIVSIFLLTECDEPDVVLNETLTITPDSLTVSKALFVMWQLKVTITDSDCNSVIWSSENPRIVTVDEMGYITPVNKGVTYIVATQENG